MLVLGFLNKLTSVYVNNVLTLEIWLREYSFRFFFQFLHIFASKYNTAHKIFRELAAKEQRMIEEGKESEVPSLKEIIEMETTSLAKTRSVSEWRDNEPQDFAAKLSRQKLYNLFPTMKQDTLSQILMAHHYCFKKTIEVSKTIVAHFQWRIRIIILVHNLLCVVGSAYLTFPHHSRPSCLLSHMSSVALYYNRLQKKDVLVSTICFLFVYSLCDCSSNYAFTLIF